MLENQDLGILGFDFNNKTNDFAPEITIIQPGGPGYSVDMLNDGISHTVIIVYVTDEDNYTSEGSSILSVKIDLSAFIDKVTSNPIGWVNMVDDGSIPDDIAYDDYWTYNLSFKKGQTPGIYYVNLNATDNGTMPGPLWTNTGEMSLQNIKINVIQYNRNMTTTPAGPIMMVESGPDVYLELNDTVFFDPDLSDPNILDSLTFMVLDGDSWETSYDGPDFTVTIAPGEDGNVTFHPKPGQSTSGELVHFSAEDTDGHWRELFINVIITDVNDPPSWLNAPVLPVEVTEGIVKNISVDAEDPDSSTLEFTAYMFLGDDDTNTSWELTVDEPVANTANITLLVDDKEVMLEWTGLSINLTVSDTEFIDYAIFELDIINVNDDPMLEYIVPIASIDTEVEEDELGYNITFKATDYDPDEALWFDFRVDEYTGMDSAVENKIEITTISSTDAMYDLATDTYITGMVEAMLNFTPDNDDVGIIKINVSITDGDETVWIVTDITIANTNDAPYFTKAAGAPVTTGDMLDYTGINSISVGEYLNITIEADDDDVIHGTETLFFSANASLISDYVLKIEKWGDTKANLSFNFPGAYVGTDTYKITVSDDDNIKDWIWLKIELQEAVSPPPSKPRPPSRPEISTPNATATYYAFQEILFDSPLSTTNTTGFLFKWHPGDGTPGSEWLSINDLPWKHTYFQPGEYIITLTIQAPNGLINSTLLKINVTEMNGTNGGGGEDNKDESVDTIEMSLIIIVPIVIIILIIGGIFGYFILKRTSGKTPEKVSPKKQPDLEKPPPDQIKAPTLSEVIYVKIVARQ
jgi:hypothetical protein